MNLDDRFHLSESRFISSGIPHTLQLLIIPIHLLNALLPSGGTYTMDNPEAAEAALAINPEAAIPMHRWDTNPEEFKRRVEASSKMKVILLKSGEKYDL